jgi:hypothetical protein
MATRKSRPSDSRNPKTPTKKSGVRKAKEQPVKQGDKSPPTAKLSSIEQAVEMPILSVGDVGAFGRIVADLDKVGQAKFRVSCARADDLLVCDFVFENLKLDHDSQGKPRLVRTDPNAAATLTVEFPPQSFGEEAFLDKVGQPNQEPKTNGFEKFPEKLPSTPPPPVPLEPHNVVEDGPDLPPLPSSRIRMAGPSRIAFTMLANELELSLNIEAILDACRRWPMRLDVNAVADPSRLRGLLTAGLKHQWLNTVVESASWARTTQLLVDALGREHQRSLAGAARRVSRKLMTAMRSGGAGLTRETLRSEMDQELEILMKRSRSLSTPQRREIASAALSLMTAEALSGFRLEGEVVSVFDKFPFLPLIFGPHKPGANVTALELPYRLIISPVPQSFWHHRTTPVAHNGRTELWHTRLSSANKDIGPDGSTNFRALWSPDYKIPNIIEKVNENLPFRMSLDPLDREMLVRLMAGFDEEDTRKHRYHPTTSSARRLSLSSLGALLDAEGSWERPVPQGVGLEQWRHLATLGRDHYVRVVYRGFLKDFGHAASLVKVTERKFEFIKDQQGRKTTNRVAVLRQKFFIIVRERVKRYNGAGHANSGRTFPFSSVEILTRVTPTLLAPDQLPCRLNDPSGIIYNGASGPDGKQLGVPRRACFWPMVDNSNNFMFQVAATDLSGNTISFTTPLLFVGVEANEHQDPNIMKEIIKRNNEATPPRRVAQIGGDSVCYAPFDPGAKGDTRLPTTKLVFRAAEVTDAFKKDFKEEPQFYPEIETARCGITAIRRLLQKPDATVDVEYADAYVTTPGGFGGKNAGELFLKLKTAFPLEFGEQVKSDAIGGLASPDMAILGLSRIMGPASGKPPSGSQTPESNLGTIIKNEFNPLDFFEDAKILGGVKLVDILKTVTGLSEASVPKLLHREIDHRVEASFDWITDKIKGDPKGLFVPNYQGTTTLNMSGVVSAPLDGSAAPTFNAKATLDSFRVNLFGFVTIWFDKLMFSAQTGSKPDVVVDLHPGDRMIEFGGPLEFVNELRSIIPSNGFSDPPSLSVTPSGISASYSINIPSLAVGIFALEHLSIGAGFLLPFDARPAEVRFNFAERQRPFSLTVSLLGGGGFFALGVGTEGVREIEAALEFGAALSINLGVASGSVEIKAGIYFHWKTQTVELAGYVRLHGELSVLGLISASLTFNLQLAYTKENKRSVVWGEASIEVEIDVLFVSFSVSVSCRREFGGSDGDPKFIQLIPDQATWNEYCEAFEAEAA